MASQYEKPHEFLFNHHQDRKYPSSTSSANAHSTNVNDSTWYRPDNHAHSRQYAAASSRTQRSGPTPGSCSISMRHVFVALTGFLVFSYYLMNKPASQSIPSSPTPATKTRYSTNGVAYSDDLVSRHVGNMEQVIGQVEETQTNLHTRLDAVQHSNNADSSPTTDLSNINGILELSKRLEDSRNRHAQIEEEINSLLHQKDTTLKELSKANASYSSSLASIQRAPSSLESVRENLRNIEEEIESTKSKLAHQAESIQSHSTIRQQLEQAVISARMKLQTRRSKSQSQESSVKTAQAEVASLQAQLQEHEKRERETDANIAKVQEKQKEARRKLEESKAQQRGFDSAMRILNLKIDSRKSALQMVKKVTSVGGGTLRDAIEAKERVVEDLKLELSEFKQQETDIEEGDGTSDTIDDALSVVRWAREEELRNRERAIEAEENMLKFYVELEAKDLDTARATLETDLEKLQREKTKLSAKISEKKSNVVALEGKLSDVEEQARQAEQFLETADQTRSRIEISLQNAETELDDMKTYATELKNEMIQGENNLKSAEDSLANHDDMKSNGEEHRNHLVQERTRLEREAREVQSQVLKLIQQQEVQLFEVREQESRVSKALGDVDELEKQLRSLYTQREGVADQIDELARNLRQYVGEKEEI